MSQLEGEGDRYIWRGRDGSISGVALQVYQKNQCQNKQDSGQKAHAEVIDPGEPGCLGRGDVREVGMAVFASGCPGNDWLLAKGAFYHELRGSHTEIRSSEGGTINKKL